MNKNEFLKYIDHHCRFRLKSGKDIYGIVWQHCKKTGDEALFYFSTKGEAIKSNACANNAFQQNSGLVIKPAEVIHAEKLAR